LRADLLAARREQLLVQSERLRLALASDAAELSTRFGLVDRIAAVGRSGIVRMLLSAGATLLLFGRTRRVLGIVSRLLVIYPLVRRVWRLFNPRP
jgi:hypothetical protein